MCNFFDNLINQGHLNEIWTMAVSHDGKYVVTGSHDKSMRIWEKTNEPLVLEDERENVGFVVTFRLQGFLLAYN